jgi:hypothetical protein
MKYLVLCEKCGHKFFRVRHLYLTQWPEGITITEEHCNCDYALQRLDKDNIDLEGLVVVWDTKIDL